MNGKRLTVHRIAKLQWGGRLSKKKGKPLTDRYLDERGLYLQITPTGVKSWLLRYERRGRERWMCLGSMGDYTLAEARELARKARQLLKEGIDPIERRKAERKEAIAREAKAAAVNVTFAECAEQYYSFHGPKWKNRKHAAQFMSSLKMYAFKIMGEVPVAAIDKAMVLRVLEQHHRKKPHKSIWTQVPETASPRACSHRRRFRICSCAWLS